MQRTLPKGLNLLCIMRVRVSVDIRVTLFSVISEITDETTVAKIIIMKNANFGCIEAIEPLTFAFLIV